MKRKYVIEIVWFNHAIKYLTDRTRFNLSAYFPDGLIDFESLQKIQLNVFGKIPYSSYFHILNDRSKRDSYFYIHDDNQLVCACTNEYIQDVMGNIDSFITNPNDDNEVVISNIVKNEYLKYYPGDTSVISWRRMYEILNEAHHVIPVSLQVYEIMDHELFQCRVHKEIIDHLRRRLDI
jgi:hypothetical protein